MPSNAGADCRHGADSLNEVVISGLAGVRTVLTVADQTYVNEARIGRPHIFVCELEPLHRSRTIIVDQNVRGLTPVSYTHLRAHETRHDLVCRLLLEKK